MINSVQIGPLWAEVAATLTVVDDRTSQIDFLILTYRLFGIPLYIKNVAFAGEWKYIHHGTFTDVDGKNKLLRVMETPSLFILTQDLNPEE